jgi:hypothetical protein
MIFWWIGSEKLPLTGHQRWLGLQAKYCRLIHVSCFANILHSIHLKLCSFAGTFRSRQQLMGSCVHLRNMTMLYKAVDRSNRITTRVNRRDNQEWTKQKHWQHRIHKTQEKINTRVNRRDNQEWLCFFCSLSCVFDVVSVSVLFFLDCPFCLL